jgi:hypothetical protein
MVKTNELDPTYPVVRHLLQTHDDAWKGRFLLHYAWFYNLMDAIKAADETDDSSFWGRCMNDGQGTDVKRGGARRHFRADNARAAVTKMGLKGQTPWEVVNKMYHPKYVDMLAYITAKYAGTQFGPYYIWKMMDWYTIGLDWPVALGLDAATRVLPDVPKKAAAEFFPNQDLRHTLGTMTDFVSQFDHPVLPGVKCGISEVETILCGLNASYGKGHLAIGADITHQYQVLGNRPDLCEHLPPVILGQYQLGKYRHVD